MNVKEHIYLSIMFIVYASIYSFPLKPKQYIYIYIYIYTHIQGASQYPSSSPRSSILLPMTRKPIELSHIEGHLNSLIAPGGVEGRGGRRLPEES